MTDGEGHSKTYTSKVLVQYLVVAFNGASCDGVPPEGGYLTIDGRLHGSGGGDV